MDTLDTAVTVYLLAQMLRHLHVMLPIPIRSRRHHLSATLLFIPHFGQIGSAWAPDRFRRSALMHWSPRRCWEAVGQGVDDTGPGWSSPERVPRSDPGRTPVWDTLGFLRQLGVVSAG
ncbi:hypothetical protein ACFYVR_24695 [Rhodococcus sp. NPDC003318]|uniref:hypothetical protein n=1 Tax=Rhodococcus sp. NPDC003318 TaxID=3364503 RepID=UPI00369C7739